jgi:hypothetical protein
MGIVMYPSHITRTMCLFDNESSTLLQTQLHFRVDDEKSQSRTPNKNNQ